MNDGSSLIPQSTNDTSTLSEVLPKTCYFSYVFKHDLKDVLYLLRDWIKTSEIIANRIDYDMSDFLITKGNNTWEKGSEFSFSWKKSVRFHKRVLEYEERENYAKIVLFVYKMESSFFDFYLYVHFNRDYTGKYTTLSLKRENMQFVSDEEKLNADRFKAMKVIDDYLKNKQNLKEQNEVVFVDSTLDHIWTYVSDLRKLAKTVPLICDDVVCDDPVVIEGTELILEWKQQNVDEKLQFVKLKVNRITTNNTFCKIEYETIVSNPTVPKQLIIWKVAKADGDFVKIKFSHKYSENIEYENIKAISVMKKKILKQLKQKLE
jgi:hypothetical protein